MTAIISVLLGLWIAKGLVNVLIGIGQILVGLICGVAAGCLFVIASVFEGLETLWQIAFPRSH